jgi:hypothetical protein
MPLYKFENRKIIEVKSTSFGLESILERDVQSAIRDNIDTISPNTLIISEEFSEWSEGNRRINLLGIDKDAKLVVIELKRDEIGAHMELQALRYAAMISTMTFKRTIEIYQRHLSKVGIEEDAEAKIKDFLGWDEYSEEQFPVETRIILASANFSKELTTTVMWLNDHNIDLRCVRLKPYKLDEKVLLDIEQIIPLPEAEDYQVKVREQNEERKALVQARDMTRYLFMGRVYPKNRLVLAVVTEYLRENPGITKQELKILFPDYLQGPLGVTNDLQVASEKLSKDRTPRYFLTDEEILEMADGSKIVVCNQWGRGNIENFIDHAIKQYNYQIEAK